MTFATLAQHLQKSEVDFENKPTCQDGVPVCLPTLSKPVCEDGVNIPICDCPDPPICLASTSEGSFAYRADPADDKTPGPPISAASRLFVGGVVAAVAVMVQ